MPHDSDSGEQVTSRPSIARDYPVCEEVKQKRLASADLGVRKIGTLRTSWRESLACSFP